MRLLLEYCCCDSSHQHPHHGGSPVIDQLGLWYAALGGIALKLVPRAVVNLVQGEDRMSWDNRNPTEEEPEQCRVLTPRYVAVGENGESERSEDWSSLSRCYLQQTSPKCLVWGAVDRNIISGKLGIIRKNILGPPVCDARSQSIPRD